METNCWKLIDRAKITQRKEEKMLGLVVRESGMERKHRKQNDTFACSHWHRYCERAHLHRKRSVCLRFYANRLEHEIVRCGVCTMIERESERGNESIAVEV